MGYEDPINPNYDATSDMYHRCLAECMERMRDAKALRDGSEKRVGIMVASHNADTIRFAIEKMKEYDIKVTFLMFTRIMKFKGILFPSVLILRVIFCPFSVLMTLS